MIGLLMVGIITTAIDSILDGMGVPKSEERDKKAAAIAQCVLSVELGSSKTDALTELFRGMGLNGWKNETMVHATIEALENVKKSASPQTALVEQVENLRLGAKFVGLQL